MARIEREYFARCAGGFEDVLAQELRSLRMRRVRPQVGGVIFYGSLADAYRACLWLRCATRVQLVLERVPASDAEALYQGIYALQWEEHVPSWATIAVDAHGENPELRNTTFVAMKVKDAVCDRLRELRGVRPDVNPKNPDIAIDVAVHPKKATVYLNLSGASLHRRGYREEGVQTEAPLKETLAAGILLAAGWPEHAQAGGALVDPMCGSGTFAIEAAMMAADIAPGLLREHWGFEGWMQHDTALWEQVCAEVQMSRTYDTGLVALAGDLDARAIEIARANARRAGVDDLIHFFVDDAANIKRHLRALRVRDGGGLLVANPPYGQRLLSDAELPKVNAALSSAIEVLPRGWKAALVTPDTTLDTALGRTPTQVIACHNGPLQVWVRLYDLDGKRQLLDITSLSGTQRSVPVADAGSAQFAARLRKAGKERARWARKEGVGCYRVYDADVPDFAVIVDLYEGVDGNRHAVVQEHRRPASIDELRAGRRFADAVALSSAVLDIPVENVLVRPWESERRGSRKVGRDDVCPVVVIESGCTFGLDLNGRPDTGLPLEMRGVRALVGSMASGKRVANLFGTTGAASVYAAAAGASSIVSVDAFADRVELMRDTMRRNGHVGKRYRYTCEDARTWLEREAKAHNTYDLVVCAPPTWLAARNPNEQVWELQRDHVALLRQAAQVLAKDGTIVFACYERTFKLDKQKLQTMGLQVKDVSAQTLPHDFERSAKTYHCYLISKS